MTKLKKEQHKIAKDFLKKLKEDFDDSRFIIYYQAYTYMGWHFDYNDWAILTKIRLYNDEDECDMEEIRIRPSIITRIKIMLFLRRQKIKKNRKTKRASLMRELEPTKLKIEETFARPTEVYEALNNGNND